MSFKMKYSIQKNYLTSGSKRRSGIKMPKVVFIVAHDTGNPRSTALNNVTYYERSRNEMSASAHIFVDDKNIIECIPALTGTPEKAWHVEYQKPKDNELFGGDSNDIAIGVEYCYGNNINSTESYKRYIWTMAYICYKFKLDPNKSIVGHHILDPGRKIDPVNGLKDSGRTYEQMLRDVVLEYNDCIGSSVNNGFNNIFKERIYESNGRLVRCDGDYKTKATDVRHIRFQTGKVKYRFVYEKGAKVSELVKKYKADYGINAPFFSGSGEIYGNAKDGDTNISQPYGKMLKRHEFVSINGKPQIGQFDLNQVCDLMIQGAPLLVENGLGVSEKYRVDDEVLDDVGKSRCQRTFIWIDKNGDLNVGVADGRTSSDQGLSLKEMELYALSKGAVMALGLDGGGSTIIADQSGGLNQKANTGVNERVTHHALLIFIDKNVDSKGDDKVQSMQVETINTQTGERLTAEAFLNEDKTFVEIRSVAEFLGAKVHYDAATKKVTVIK